MPQESIRNAIARRMTHLGDELHILRAVEGLVSELEGHHPGTQVTLTDSAVSIIVPLPRVAGGVETSDNSGAVSHLVPDTWEPVHDATDRCAERDGDQCGPEGGCRYHDGDPEPSAQSKRAKSPRNAETAAWTDDEDQRVWALRKAGRTTRQIAEALGRSQKAVSVRLYKKIKPAMEAGAASPTQPSATEPDPEPEPPEPTPPQAREPEPEYMGPHEPLDSARAMRRHLDVLGNTAFWTPGRDLSLIEQVGRGRKLKDVAEEMGVSKADAAARFRELCPEPGISTQQFLLDELRRRAPAIEAAQ